MYPQHGLWKWRNTYYFLENSAYFVFELELLLTMLSKPEGKVVLQDSAYWWVACLTHKVSWSVYRLITDLIGLALYMIRYIQYWWWLVVELSRTNEWNRWRTWWGLSWRGFQLTKVKCDRDGDGGREFLCMGRCSINIWDGLELELAWFKKSSSYFDNKLLIFLLSGILNTSSFKLHDVL